MQDLLLPSATKPRDNATCIFAADLIVAYLEGIGVEYVFGVPGGAVEPLYDALARSQRRGGPRPVVARHESGAAFMADGYARETGNIGVCVTTSGPGATNAITGVACAYDNKVPLLAITGQPALPSFGRRALQESSCTGVNTVGMMRHCTRYNSLVSHKDQLENKLVSALVRASQSPQGPSHLAIPVDILRSPAMAGAPAYDLTGLLKGDSSLIDEQAVRGLKAELDRAPRIVFLIGSGCAEAAEAILRLAELTRALFITTPDGKGYVNPRHPAFRGVFGFGGHASADALLRGGPDLLVAFGTSFSELSSNGWSNALMNNRLIHVDGCEENFMHSPMARLHVGGRTRTVCERLIELMQAERGADAAPAAERDFGWHDAAPAPEESPRLDSGAAPIRPQRLMQELSERCPPNTRFVADIGNSMIWATHCLQPHDRRTAAPPQGTFEEPWERRAGTASWLRVTLDFCPMGWAIGAAVGIASGSPTCPVVCITGDGSYLMNGQEITVAAQQQLTVVFVVLNDGALGMVKHGQRLAGAEPIAFELPRVDFRLLAQSMGIPGHVIESPRDLQAVDFDAILRRRGPTLLDVRIDPEEVPPMILRLKTLGAIK